MVKKDRNVCVEGGVIYLFLGEDVHVPIAAPQGWAFVHFLVQVFGAERGQTFWAWEVQPGGQASEVQGA